MAMPNQHYSDYADSHSVMYGECITDLGGGSFKFQGCPRKYSQLDQYLMGLRAPCEVSPMMVLVDPMMPTEGVDSISMSATAAPITRSGLVRHDISIDDVIRAMGVRNPAYPAANRCWRVAFVVVLAPGQNSIPTDMRTKVLKYQQRWPGWFFEATDYRGAMITRITGPGCPEQDGGPVFDPICPPDGGTEPFDAGMEPFDAGIEPEDAGVEMDAGGEMLTGGTDAGHMDDLSKLRPGCGCGAADAAAWGLLAAALLLRPRRRSA
jgi:hypothetical protein